MSGQTQLSLPAVGGDRMPVAADVGMSTEHQQYSTENQLDRIKEYAAKRGIEIVRVAMTPYSGYPPRRI
jgi:N-acetyl-beta-hexosaminidase